MGVGGRGVVEDGGCGMDGEGGGGKEGMRGGGNGPHVSYFQDG